MLEYEFYIMENEPKRTDNQICCEFSVYWMNEDRNWRLICTFTWFHFCKRQKCIYVCLYILVYTKENVSKDIL